MKTPPTKPSEGISARALARLTRQARDGGQSLSQLARAMGYNPGYLSTAEGPHLSRIVDGVVTAGLNPRSFFEGLFVDRRMEPRLLLRQERENFRHPRDPFLRACDPMLLEISTREFQRGRQGAAWRPYLEELEDRRFRDGDAARRGFEAFIVARLEEVRSLPASIPASVVADLAAAFTGWSAIQRMKGHRNGAADGLEIAFSLGRRSGDRWALGLCYKRGAFLVREFGRSDIGLDWTDEATQCFVMAGEILEQQQMMVDRAIMLEELGVVEDAKESFEAALRVLPASYFRHLASARHGLALMAQKARDLLGAQRHLEAGLALFTTPDYIYGHSLWRLGTVQLELGLETPGIKSLRRALALLVEHGSPFDVAPLFFEIAEILTDRGMKADLIDLANECRQWISHLGGDGKLREEFENVIALIYMGQLTSAHLMSARQAVESATTARHRSR